MYISLTCMDFTKSDKIKITVNLSICILEKVTSNNTLETLLHNSKINTLFYTEIC